MSASPSVPLRNAIDTVVQTSSFFAGNKLYLEGSDALRGAALPYVIYGTCTETFEGADSYNGQRSHDSTVQLKAWGADKHQAEQGYAELKAKLDEAALSVTGHIVTRPGRLSKVTDFPEPNPEVGGHVVVTQYRIRTLAA